MRSRSPWITGLLLVIASVAITQLAALLVNEWSETVEIRGLFRVALTVAVVVASIVFAVFLERSGGQSSARVHLFSDTFSTSCGDEPLDLRTERLFLSSTLGTYFASLLEAPDTYHLIEGQIECHIPETLAELNPFQRILYELVNRNGAHTLVIASDGGMGKSTLAAKLVRCLYGRSEYTRILGDSAKDEVVEIHTAKTKSVEQGFVDRNTFFSKLADQLGVGGEEREQFSSPHFIRNYLAGQDVLIVIDNVDSVEEGDTLVKTVGQLTGRSIRAIITTRKAEGFERNRKSFVVHLKPIQKPKAAIDFVEWHISAFAQSSPDLLNLQRPSRAEAKLLIEKSGGVPLVMQLLLSDVASKGWVYLKNLRDPGLPEETLDFFFQQRWTELQNSSEIGLLAIEILSFVGARQLEGQRISIDDLSIAFAGRDLKAALGLLHNRFLILNRDVRKGDFTIFPHLIQFMTKRQLMEQ